MKTILLLLLLLLTFVSSFSQTNTSQDYLTKSHHQNTAAWIMLGGGVGLTALSVAISEANTVDYASGNSSNHNTAGTVLAVAGIASVVGSIPMFISASHNKHKAAELSFDVRPAPAPLYVANHIACLQPVLKLNINL